MSLCGGAKCNKNNVKGVRGVSNRKTLAGVSVCAGIGLHSGERVRMVLKPAAPGTGITFIRTDLKGDNRIAAHVENVTTVRLGTTIENAEGAKVATVEHLMSALAGLGVDDAVIEIDGPETPAMDGSAAPFVELIRQAGLKTSAAPLRVIRVLKPVSVELQGRTATFLPSIKPAIDVEISFPHPTVGRQRYAFDVNDRIFTDDVAAARTFGFRKDVEAMHAAGLALGGSMDNAVVIDDDGIANPEGLRFADEFARHKALDALGDLSLAGAPVFGRYFAHQPGHALNVAAVRALLADKSAWKMVAYADAEAVPALATVDG